MKPKTQNPILWEAPEARPQPDYTDTSNLKNLKGAFATIQSAVECFYW